MANEVLVKTRTQIRFSGSGFSPADSGTNYTIGTPTVATLSLSAVADGAGRQSAKADLGAVRAPRSAMQATVDFTGETPTAGERIDFYWAPSTGGTTGNGNVAGNSGNDAAAPVGALGSIALAEFIRQCLYIGSLTVHAGASMQNGYVGTFSPPERYGQMIVVNESGAAAFEANNVEAHVVINPIVDEIQ